MRKAFVKTIEQLFNDDPKVVLFLGDIGAFLMRNIREKYPERFFNVGISEAAMMSAAAGMALDGWKPFVYTITPFVTARCFDQIRVGVGCHHANVKIVGIGSGLSYSPLGTTHHSLEDLAIMKTIPGMRIYTPRDSKGTVNAVVEAARVDGPAYIRLTLNLAEQPEESKKSETFQDIETVHQGGNKIVIFSYGETVEESSKACEKLEKVGIKPTLIAVNSLKPLNKKIGDTVRKAKHIFVVEEHSVIGGLGSSIAEVIAELPLGTKPQLARIGVNDSYVGVYGKKTDLYKYVGLDSTSIYQKVTKACKKT
jgi:transketolase